MPEALPDALTAARYISLETFRRDGRAVRTPVWFAPLHGELVVYTDDTSGKAKRLRNSPRVRVAPCTMNGNVLGAWQEMTAHFIRQDEAPQEWKQAFRALVWRQGVAFVLFVVLGRLGLVPKLRHLERHRVIIALRLA